MEKNKSNHLAVCVICGALTVFGLVASIISLAGGSEGIRLVKDIVNLVLFVLVGYYAVYGYRIPNGNLLKYLILIFAATYIIAVFNEAQMGKQWDAVSHTVMIGLLCFTGGRLHKVKQNIALMSIVAAILLARIIIGFVQGDASIGIVTQLVIWIDICVAYVLRYKEHKLAGLVDKVNE